MSFSISLTEVQYEIAGHYFIKVFLEFDKDNSKSSSSRTEVSQTTQTPNYTTNTFQFTLPKGHALSHKKSYFSKINTTGIKCILQACQIERTSTEKDPSLKIAGSVTLTLYPNETLQESLYEMKVIYFTTSDKTNIGKAIATMTIHKEAEKQDQSNQRVLDPMESFEQLPKTPTTRNGSAKGLEDTVPDMPSKATPDTTLSRETSNPSLARALSGLVKSNEKPIKEYMKESSTPEKNSPIKANNDGLDSVLPSTPISPFIMAESKLKGSKKDIYDSDNKQHPVIQTMPSTKRMDSKTNIDYRPQSASSEIKPPRIPSAALIQEAHIQQKNGNQASNLQNKDDAPLLESKEHEKDIDQRQRLIDRLLEELDSRTEAVRKVGQDLYKLREMNASNEKIISKLEKKISENELLNTKMINTIDIDLVPQPELVKRYAVLANRLQATIETCKDLTERLETAQEKVIEKNDLEKHMLELQQAHTVQQVYVQKLQDKLEQASRFKSTIKIQEQIIRKLEIMLQDKESNKRSEYNPSDFMSKGDGTQDSDSELIHENDELRRRISDLERMLRNSEHGMLDPLDDFKRELEEERLKLKNLDSKSSSQTQDPMKDFTNLLRAEKAESRVKVLEQELIDNARQFAKQLTELEIQLQEAKKVNSIASSN